MKDRFSDTMIDDIAACPICYNKESKLEVKALDKLFKSSSRKWQYRRCLACATLFLSNRPKKEHIGLAYDTYYTHNQNTSLTRAILDFVVAAYLSAFRGKRNIRHVFNFAWPVKMFLDAKTRNIAEIEPGRVFDFGCGNGDFLKRCQTIGWICEGMDLDERAVESGRAIGLSLDYGGVEALVGKADNAFDLVTVSHVIEHVYDVDALLAHCLRILKPGGILWLETPNAYAHGLFHYKANWRGLEPPRHLHLFTKETIKKIMKRQGFVDIKFKHHFLSSVYMALASEKIKQEGSNDYLKRAIAILNGLTRDVFNLVNPRSSEFITVTCKKQC